MPSQSRAALRRAPKTLSPMTIATGALLALIALLAVPAVLQPARAAKVPAAAPAAAASAIDAAQFAALGREIDRLERESGATLGVAAGWLGAAPAIVHRGDEPFPMASTFKVAVAGAVLSRADAGTERLDRMIAIDAPRYVESDIIAARLIHPGVQLSVHNLLELMLTESDNTATDVLVEIAGGAAEVTKWLRAQGVTGQRVDRDTAGLLRDFFGLGPEPFPDALAAAVAKNPALEQIGDKPNPAFDDDIRDTSTPLAMAALLDRIQSGRALSAASTKVIVDIMTRCRTGAGRLKGLLPAGTVVAHKTGTIGGTVNDVGVVTLPGGRRYVIAVFIKKSARPIAERERTIAEVSRTIRDAMLVREGER